MKTKPNTRLPAIPPLSSSDLLADIETALVTINGAEGFLLVGNIAHGMRMLAKGKSILERIVSANDPAQAGRTSDILLSTETRSRPCLEPDG